jgi:hypothetical protein
LASSFLTLTFNITYYNIFSQVLSIIKESFETISKKNQVEKSGEYSKTLEAPSLIRGISILD